jgi:hypothetical protein
MTTTRDNATTWRELADDLTPSQRDSMEFVEREFAARPTARNATADLLDIARGHIEQTSSTSPSPASRRSISRAARRVTAPTPGRSRWRTASTSLAPAPARSPVR